MNRETMQRAVLVGGAAGFLVTLAGCGPALIEPGRQEAFRSQLGNMRIAVYPASVRRGSTITQDPAAAEELAAFLRSQGWAEAHAVESDFTVGGSWQMNEANMWRESAAAFAAHVRAHPPADADYALLTEYLMGSQDAGGIHGYVVDLAGNVVDGFLANSHHEAFQKVAPKSTADCTEVIRRLMREDWPAAAAAR